MNLSPNFTLAELTHSQIAVRQGLDNTPPPLIVDNLRYLCATLEQVRVLVGRPLFVSSGYRAPAVNKAAKGSDNSAHMLGLAADITTSRCSPLELAQRIRDSGIEFDQLIHEFGEWVHIGLADKPRGEVLTARRVNGRVVYSKGLA